MEYIMWLFFLILFQLLLRSANNTSENISPQSVFCIHNKARHQA